MRSAQPVRHRGLAQGIERFPQPSSSDGSSGLVRRLPWLLAFIGAATFANGLPGSFVYDDGYIGDWFYDERPVFALSLEANLALHGRSPLGFHVVNLLIHVLASLTLYGVLRRTYRLATGDPGTRGSLFAVTAALLWMVHPLQTESVSYIWQRCESLMGLFTLLTLYCLVRFAEPPRSRLWAVATLAAFLLAVGSKETGAVIPAILLVYDRTFLSGSFGQSLRLRPVLYLMLFGSWVAAFSVLIFGQLALGATIFEASGTDPLQYALTQLEVVPHYLLLAFWPSPLCIEYEWPVATRMVDVLPEALVVVALLTGTVWALVRRSWLGFAGAWFFLELAPTSSIVPLPQTVAEHRMYLPLAAVVVIAVVAGGRLLLSFATWPWTRTLGVIMATAALVALTVRRNLDYRSSEVLWASTVEASPTNPRAWHNLAVAMMHEERLEEAEASFRRAAALSPSFDDFNMLGVVLKKLGRTDEAEDAFRRATSFASSDHDAHINLGNLLVARGDIEGAHRLYVRALEIRPEAAVTHYYVGSTSLQLGRKDVACVHLLEALERKLDPRLREPAARQLSWILSTSRDPALRNGGEALRIAHELTTDIGCKSARCLEVLAAAHAEYGQFPEAVRIAGEALRLAAANGRPKLAQRIEAQLRGYREQRAWRE